MGNEIKFKPATFYLGVADYLAKVVEGLESEDVGTGKGKSKQGAKLGHGEILDGGIAQVEVKQAHVSDDGATTEIHPTRAPASGQPNTDGNGESVGPGPNQTNIFLSGALGVTKSTPLTHKSISNTYPPRQHTPESKLRDPIPVRQITKPDNDK